MKQIKKKYTHIIVIAIMTVAVVMTGVAASNQVFAAVNDKSDSVYFEEQYAAPGNLLTVKYDGSETELTYKWFVDGEAVASEENEDGSSSLSDTFEILAAHYQKTIKAEVYDAAVKLGEATMFVSKLPVLYIDTEGGAEVVTKDYYLNAQMHVQGNDKYNSDNSTLYTGATEIKGRGNSTWKLFPKKPYRLKLDKKVDLLGLGKSKHWVLLANYIDESGMRNMLAGELATRMGVGKMDGTWVEVVMNGENLGMYMLCEHVRLAEDRVNVFDWESAAEDIAEAIADANGFSEDEMDALTDYMAEEDMSWISTGEVVFNGVTYKTADYYEDLPESFSGGYLLELDLGYDEVSKFTTDNGAPIMFKSPEFIYTDETAMDAVKDYVQTFEDALYSKDFNTDADGKKVSYTEMCDMDSLVGFWLSSEMMINEIGYKSTYFQKDIDQPLTFGPVWDFDYSSGAVTPYGKQNATDWTSDNKVEDTGGDKWWFNKLMKDPYFAVKVREKFIEQEDYLKNVVADGGVLDQWYDYLRESGQFNYELWQYANGFEADYQTLDSWLTERINWMDKQFATNESAMRSMGIEFSDKFSVQLNGETVSLAGGKSYIAPAGSEDFDLSIAVSEGEYKELNYYVNSRYQGTVAIVDGKANIVIKEEQLTEAIGKDNVITVWLKDDKGTLAEQQYLTVKLTSDKNLYNVVFNDMGSSYAVKVVAGDKVFIDVPQRQDGKSVFEGWSDGQNIYEQGKWLTVNEDITLNAVWSEATEGDETKPLVNIRACAFTCSDRYSNYYTGKELKPVITVSDGDELLTEGEDYTIEFKKTVDVGYAIYTIKGIEAAGYTGEVTLSYRIIARNISGASIVMPSTSVLSGDAAKPEISIAYNGMTLTEGKDYDVAYNNNTKVGEASVTITGKGNFTGEVTKNFDVVASAKSITKCTFAKYSTKTYTGSAVKPVPIVKDGSKKLVAGADYTVKYSNNVKCGTAKATITGVAKNGYKGSKTITFNIRPGKPTVTVANVKYNQQKVTWSKVTGATSYNVYRSFNNKTYTLIKTVGSSSRVLYCTKGLDAGKTCYYKVKAIRTQKDGNKTIKYSGIVSNAVKLKTVLYKSTITSAKNTSAKAATIKWAGINGAHGYKVYRSTTGSAGPYKLLKTVGKVKSLTNKNLTKGKTYYYKVKAYRKVDGKIVYGAASPAKGVRITK